MHKVLMIPLLAFLILSTGCQSLGNIFADRYELEKMDFVRGIGIDIIDSKYRVSVIIERPAQMSKEKSGGSGTSTGEVFYAEGRSVIDAVNRLDSISNKHMFLGQLSFIIIGEEAAKTDMIRAIDFLSRHNKIRTTSDVFISKNISALELLDKASNFDIFVGDTLNNQVENEWAKFLISPTNLLSLLGKMDNKTIGYTIPAIALSNDSSIKAGKKQINILLDGYAIFKDNKLLTYTNDNEIEFGINILNNKVSRGNIVISILNDVTVSLDILNMDTSVKTIFNDMQPEVKIETQVALNIGELNKPVDVFNSEDFDALDREQSVYLEKCIGKALEFAKENDADIFFLSEIIHRQHPYKWEELKSKWDTTFPNLPYTVNVKSQIKRSYDINQTQETKVAH